MWALTGALRNIACLERGLSCTASCKAAWPTQGHTELLYQTDISNIPFVMPTEMLEGEEGCIRVKDCQTQRAKALY